MLVPCDHIQARLAQCKFIMLALQYTVHEVAIHRVTVPENINTPPKELGFYFVLDQPPFPFYPNGSYFPLRTVTFEPPPPPLLSNLRKGVIDIFCKDTYKF